MDGSHPGPGSKPRRQGTQPPTNPTKAAHAAEQRGGPGEGSAVSRDRSVCKPAAPLHPRTPPKPGHTEGRGLRAAAFSPPSPTLPGSYRPGDGHDRPELGLAGGERRDGRREGGNRRCSPREEGAGPSSGLSGAAPGLGPAGDPRGAAERSCGRQR